MAPSGIGRMLVFLSCQGCFYFGVVLLLESSIPQRILYALRAALKRDVTRTSCHGECAQPKTHDDNDVTEEQRRIRETPLWALLSSHAIVLKDLTKRYGRFVAVDRISVAVDRGECFGLLGINGAGKTSTFQMLTGDTVISGGAAYVLGHDLKKNFSTIQSEVGYCPQFDALIEQLTGRETLEMFANLRGLSKYHAASSIDSLVEALLLRPYMTKLVKSYSGGTKRKLSTAVALIGGPRIIFLDEPSSGMDPAARRHLWDMLSTVRAAGRTLVLTSHSMEECEALCTKIAIMVNGQFRCFGSTQHLKSKFGQGYTLMIKTKSVGESEAVSIVQKVKDFVEATFPGSILKDVHQGLLHFHLTEASVKLGRVFGIAESMRTAFDVEDYSISQTTLEQVFINFAQSQVDPDDVRLVTGAASCASLCNRVCCCFPTQQQAAIPSVPNIDC